MSHDSNEGNVAAEPTGKQNPLPITRKPQTGGEIQYNNTPNKIQAASGMEYTPTRRASVVASEMIDEMLSPSRWVTLKRDPMNPIIVLFINFLFCGLGAVCNGQKIKGTSQIIVYLVTLSTILLAYFSLILIPFAGVLYIVWIIWIFFVNIDVYKIALRLWCGYPVMLGECTNKCSTWFIKFRLKNAPVFVNTDWNNAPQEWKDVIERYEIELDQPSQESEYSRYLSVPQPVEATTPSTVQITVTSPTTSDEHS